MKINIINKNLFFQMGYYAFFAILTSFFMLNGVAKADTEIDTQNAIYPILNSNASICTLTINTIGNGSVLVFQPSNSSKIRVGQKFNGHRPVFSDNVIRDELAYPCGETIELTPMSYAGWDFTGWSGMLTGNASPVILNLMENQSITATFQIVSDNPPNRQSDTITSGLDSSEVPITQQLIAAASSPSINVWHGTNQTFGQLGTPQQWINILGNISDSDDDISTVVYSLNGGTDNPVRLGPDNRRLLNTGDFNIELDKDDLNNGANQVVITATDTLSNEITTTVTVNYDNTTTWPQSYNIDWSAVSNITDVVQIVDGQWTYGPAGIRTVNVGYDRVVALGDLTWDSYEVTVPITVHATDNSAYGNPISVSPGLGLVAQWPGHTDYPVNCLPTSYLHCGWKWQNKYLPNPWYEFTQGGYGDEWRLDGDSFSDSDPLGRTMSLDTTYYWKFRVENLSGGTSLYNFKVWEDGENEPGWQMSGEEVPAREQGSLLFVAHHVDATFGNVMVEPLQMTNTLTTTVVGSGTITVEPEQSEYARGTVVTVTAVATPGSAFIGWSGDLSGATNPTNLTMDTNKTVTATFTEITSHTLTVTTVGSGTVTTEPNQVEYQTGTVVTMTAVATPGSMFANWSGDVSGTTNPITLTITGDKIVTATFTSGATIESDDFNSCTLSSMWTHYPGRSGDPAPVLSGTHVLLSVPAGLDHDIWQDGTHASRIMQPAANTDFEIKTKFDSQVNSRYQTQGILVEQENGDVLRFEFLHNGSGNYLFAAAIIGGSATAMHYVPTSGGTGTPSYMKVTRADNQWTHSYSYNGTIWTSRTFTQSFSVAQVGVYAGNTADTPGSEPAHTAIIDYFYNTASQGPGDVNQNTLSTYTVGNGSIAQNPDKTAYTCGETVTLTATAASGWAFDDWQGDLSGTDNPDTLVMDGSKTVTATFTQLFSLTTTADPVAGGTITVNPDKDSYLDGETVTITATANSGWVFDGWAGGLSGSDNPETLVMDGNKTVTATFKQLFSLTTTVDPAQGGSISVNPAKSSYEDGETVTITATANSGWVFDGWAGDLSGSDNPETLVMDGSKTVTATFTQLFSLTTTADPVAGGTITVNPDKGSYLDGETVTITATANSGWTFDGWAGDLSGSDNPKTLVMDGNKVVTATFNALTYTLSIATDGNGIGSVSKEPNQPSYYYGDVVTLTATAGLSSTFVGWSDGSTLMTRTITITQDRTLTATFNLVPEADEDKKVFLPIIIK